MLQLFLVRHIRPTYGLTLLATLPSIVHSQEHVQRIQGRICSCLPASMPLGGACASLYAHARIPTPCACPLTLFGGYPCARKRQLISVEVYATLSIHLPYMRMRARHAFMRALRTGMPAYACHRVRVLMLTLLSRLRIGAHSSAANFGAPRARPGQMRAAGLRE